MANKKKKDTRIGKQLTKDQSRILGNLSLAVDEVRNLIDRLDDYDTDLLINIRAANNAGLKFNRISIDTVAIDNAISDIESRAEELDELDSLYYEQLRAKDKTAPETKD